MSTTKRSRTSSDAESTATEQLRAVIAAFEAMLAVHRQNIERLEAREEMIYMVHRRAPNRGLIEQALGALAAFEAMLAVHRQNIERLEAREEVFDV